jgi:hypothetical protein
MGKRVLCASAGVSRTAGPARAVELRLTPSLIAGVTELAHPVRAARVRAEPGASSGSTGRTGGGGWMLCLRLAGCGPRLNSCPDRRAVAGGSRWSTRWSGWTYCCTTSAGRFRFHSMKLARATAIAIAQLMDVPRDSWSARTRYATRLAASRMTTHLEGRRPGRSLFGSTCRSACRAPRRILIRDAPRLSGQWRPGGFCWRRSRPLVRGSPVRMDLR